MNSKTKKTIILKFAEQHCGWQYTLRAKMLIVTSPPGIIVTYS